jgi:hypothetical protein
VRSSVDEPLLAVNFTVTTVDGTFARVPGIVIVT